MPGFPAEFLARLENGENVLTDSELTEYRSFLWQITDSLASSGMHGILRDVFAVQNDLALVGFDQPYDHIEAGGLAGTIGTQQANHIATAD